MKRWWLLIAACAAVAAASVLYASSTQRATAAEHRSEATLAERILSSAFRADSSIDAYAQTGRRRALADQASARSRFTSEMREALSWAADDSTETAALLEQRWLFSRWQQAAATTRNRLSATINARHRLIERLALANRQLQARQDVLARREDAAASRVPAILIIVLSVVFGACGAAFNVRSRRRVRAAADRRRRQGRFAEALQTCHGQREAHALLKTYVEQALPSGAITVLNRNNSADRLEASTPVPTASALQGKLDEARPGMCAAVRLNRPFDGGNPDEVLTCELCGGGPARDGTSCRPLLVGGEVIGSVLAEHDGKLSGEAHRGLTESVDLAAPVLANLRNLAIAETRAATDSLTGLPNRRAVDDMLLRMLAQANRNLTPLTAILMDLDHFKAINDTYGHDRGDEALAALAVVLRESIRASDFAGRSGGEEFVIFLPDTDRSGAVRLAEKVRVGLKELRIPGVEREITASFGVACFPDDAVDAETVMRCADRALYAAKRNGRDRIESSSTGKPLKQPQQ